MIIVQSLLRRCASAVMFKNSGRYIFSKSQSRDRFIKAIFQDDIKQISLMSKQQRQNFRMIYNLSGEQLSQEIVRETMDDVTKLAATLEFASNQSRKICKHLIVYEQYVKLIKKYYQYFHVGSIQKIRNKALNPNININHLIPTFIHLRNPQIRKILKQNQYNLLQILNKQTKLTLQQIMLIINTNIYNITDLPIIQRIICQQVIPKVYDMTDPEQLLSAISYLHCFNMIPLNLFQHTLKKIQTYLQKNVSNTQRQLKDDLLWLQLMAMLVLKSDRCHFMGQKYKKMLFDSYNKLVQHKYVIGDVTCSVQQLFTSEACFDGVLHHLIQKRYNGYRDEHMFKQQKFGEIYDEREEDEQENFRKISEMLKAYQKSLQLIRKKREKDLQSYPQIIPKIIKKQKIIDDQLVSKGKMRFYVQLQLWITVGKILLCGRSLDLNLNSFHIFFTTKRSKDILQKYAYYPSLFKDIIIAHEKIQAQSNDYSNKSQISKIIFQFKQKTNRALKQLLHSDKQQTIIKYTSPNYQFQLSTPTTKHLWSPNIENITKKIMHYQQDYSISSLLGMLQADPNYLQSRMKLTITDYTKIQLLDNSFNDQSVIGEWDYPHWYPITLIDDSSTPIRVIPKTAFNKFLILPKNLPPNTLYYIKYANGSIYNVQKQRLKGR